MVARQAFCLEHICRHRSSLHPWNAADDWLDRETTARYHEAIDQRLSQLLYGGDIATSWENGERAVALANLASGYLMVALYQSGQQSEGLRTYRRLRGHLVEELGMEPSRSLQELEAAILEQNDGALARLTLLPAGSR